ncbi:hypothetical protein MUY27_05910 [Mucilaginibacter sp. RS28]|uniref:TonB C-terminal domain-containing protein n=1 Tax=Mucilaginibacter straminoryzae TaxID=2932774 RepID=A0A9X2B843_9SPHI|nr:hypothetical protein [Mucilaginibacter straminoryzae]MCJ8209234.1 hypothetical protein [Mucilaginibacter straminoryzae]
MKLILTLMLTLSLAKPAYCQPKNNLEGFILKNYKPTKEQLASCEWQFALIKLHIDRQGKIVDYESVNGVPDEVMNAFKFLLGYKVLRSEPANSKLLFYFSVNNTETCNPKPGDNQHLPNDALDEISRRINSEREKDKKMAVYPWPIIFKIFKQIQ